MLFPFNFGERKIDFTFVKESVINRKCCCRKRKIINIYIIIIQFTLILSLSLSLSLPPLFICVRQSWNSSNQRYMYYARLLHSQPVSCSSLVRHHRVLSPASFNFASLESGLRHNHGRSNEISGIYHFQVCFGIFNYIMHAIPLWLLYILRMII